MVNKGFIFGVIIIAIILILVFIFFYFAHLEAIENEEFCIRKGGIPDSYNCYIEENGSYTPYTVKTIKGERILVGRK